MVSDKLGAIQIVENFAIDAGEIVFGEIVPQRKVHSVNSWANATKLNRFRLCRLARTMGMIPETTDQAAFNQWVFPADEAECLIERIENAIPQNQVMEFLGCSITQVEHLVRNDIIVSITPMTEGQVGQMRGNFNRDDLNEFLASVSLFDKPSLDFNNDFVVMTENGTSAYQRLLRCEPIQVR